MERSRTDMVAVALQFFSHAQAKDGLLSRVMQDVQTDQTRVEVPIRFRSKRFWHGFLRRSDTSPTGSAEALERTLAGMIVD